MVKGMLMVSAFVSVLFFASNVESYYYMSAEVVYVKNGYAEVVDECGEKWGLWADDLQENELIKIKFDENHTTDRSDDLIVDYKYFN